MVWLDIQINRVLLCSKYFTIIDFYKSHTQLLFGLQVDATKSWKIKCITFLT
jgi:hypothetical protein